MPDDLKFVKGYGDKGKALFFWKVDCNEQSAECRRHMGYSAKPSYLVLIVRAEIGKLKTEFESGNSDIDVFRTYVLHSFLAGNKKGLDHLIEDLDRNNEYDIIDAGSAVDCCMIDTNRPGKSVHALLDKYGNLYFRHRKGVIDPKVSNLLNNIDYEQRQYENMNIDAKLSILCHLTGQIYDNNSTKKESEFATGEIERIAATFDKKYNLSEFVHSVNKKHQELSDLHLKKCFHIYSDNFEMLAAVDRQIEEAKAKLKSRDSK